MRNRLVQGCFQMRSSGEGSSVVGARRIATLAVAGAVLVQCSSAPPPPAASPPFGGRCGLIIVIDCAPTHLISGEWRYEMALGNCAGAKTWAPSFWTGPMPSDSRVRSRNPGLSGPTPKPTAEAAAGVAEAVSGDRCPSRSQIHLQLNPKAYPPQHRSLPTLKPWAPEEQAAGVAEAASGDRSPGRSRTHLQLNPKAYPPQHRSLRTLKPWAPEEQAAGVAEAVSGDRGPGRSRIHLQLNLKAYPAQYRSLPTLKPWAPEEQAAEGVGTASGH